MFIYSQAENDVKIKDGSFIKDITSGAEKKSAYETGKTSDIKNQM